MAIDPKEAGKKAHELIVDFAKQITTVASAMLSLFVSLIAAKAIALADIEHVPLIAAFIFLFFSIVASFWTILAVAGSLDSIAGEKKDFDESIFRSNIRIPLTLTVLAFLGGIGALAKSVLPFHIPGG